MSYKQVANRCAMLLGVLVVLASCGGHPGPAVAPERQAAIIGRQVVAAADQVVTGIDQAIGNGTLPKAYGIPALKVIREVGVHAQELGQAIKLIDLAKTAADQQTALGKAQVALDGIYRMLKAAVPNDGPPSVQAVLQALLGPLVDAAQRAQAALGGGR